MAPRSATRNRKKARNRKWSRTTARDRPSGPDRPMSADYFFDAHDAGEPMLSWAQAQQTVKLGRPESSERFTIANELPIISYPCSPPAAHSSREHHGKHHSKTQKKKLSAVPTASNSFDSTDRLQKSVDQVSAPPDALQESYVCDEEDHEMLKVVNSKKRFLESGPLKTGVFEEALTLLERESIKFRGLNTSFTLPVDEDAVCSVCQKGDCDNTNMILFCDMCNLAVHQECYGVPYIPEGQWHCRRCMVSPSGSAQCVLCPNIEGALKQTEDGRWAHVICALYIPKVNFKSPQLLEPIMNIDRIEKSRWRLKCSICRQQSAEKKVGACVQCEEKSCKVAFHVTCAQKAGYYMDLKPTKEDGDDSASRSGQNVDSDDVKGVAYCKKHSLQRPRKKTLKTASIASVRSNVTNKTQQQQDRRMDSLNIDSERLTNIAVEVKLDSKPKLFNLILIYWKSKRRHRNGLPLLKRPKGRNNVSMRAANYEELENQRQLTGSALRRLDKLRTSMEFQLRQEKIQFRKDKLTDVRQGFLVMPAKCVLDHVFDRIKLLDKDRFFAVPVTEKIAPKYLSIIRNPMDFSTIAKKLDQAGAYTSFDQFEYDINLIITNCTTYNTPDTTYHKFAVHFSEQVKPMLADGKRDYKEYVTDRSRRGSSVLDGPLLGPGDQESGTDAHKKSDDDDLLSEISDPEANDDGVLKTAQTNGDSHPLEDNPMASTSSSSMTCSSPLHSRTIPCSPKHRKTPVTTASPSQTHLEDSNDFDSGPARKKVRITPAEDEETNASGSRVPTPAAQDVPRSPLRPTMTTYRTTSRLGAFASESEPDPPFPSEDSADLQSDIDQDSDGPAHRLRHKRRLSSVVMSPPRREYIDYRPHDFVWVTRASNPTLPAVIMDDRSTKGVKINGRNFPPPPLDVRESVDRLTHKFPGHKHLVYFFDSKRSWEWVGSNQLDIFGLDEHKDITHLQEASPKHAKDVKRAYDLAKAHMMTSPHRIQSPLSNGLASHLTRSPT